MTSLPVGFPVGSASSGYTIKDAIASYRRSQFLISDGRVRPPSDDSYFPEDAEAAQIGYESEPDDLPTPRPRDAGLDGAMSSLEWDEAPSEPTSEAEATSQKEPAIPSPSSRTPSTSRSRTTPKHRGADERTPLLRKSRSMAERSPAIVSRLSEIKYRDVPRLQTPSTVRQIPATSAVEVPTVGGKSTFGQTLFNTIAILLGIGMLSEPLAFAYAGWIGGTILIIFCGLVTCYTAKIVARIVFSDTRIRSYADIGRKAFGPKSMPFITFLFCVELFSVSVVLVTLYADSLHAIVPAFSADAYKLTGIVLLIPTVFLPLSVLSYTSILGIISTVFLIGVVLIDGFSKSDAPGSLTDPAATSLGIWGLEQLGIAFGLFMAGFSGHAVIPSLAQDMVDPSQFDLVMNYAFAFATFIYALIGVAGYLMFGNDVSDELSQNLLGVPGYSPMLNKVALWMLVITPLTKFALTARPLNVTIENLLGLDMISPLSENSYKAVPTKSSTALKRILTVMERTVFVFMAVGVSILVPEFSSMMAILGSFSAFIMCVIGPIAAKTALEKKCSVLDAALLLAGVVMAAWGTGAAFLSTAD